jgi:hypothetical protein
VRTRGDRLTRRITHPSDCTALTRLRAKLRPLRRGRPAVRSRLRAIARRRSTCGGGVTVPIDQPAPPAPAPGPGFQPPVARFGLDDGLTPEDPLTAGVNIAFDDASQGTDLTEWGWDFGDGATAGGRNVQHAFAKPGRYTVLHTIRNARGQTSAFGLEVFVRGGGTEVLDTTIDCPDPGQTVPVTIRVVVPSWARLPAQVAYEGIRGACAADVANARNLRITPGNAANETDDWGREASTLEFTFDLTDGDGGTSPLHVTASYG